jgi:lipid-binding SYLF domain-containing protein
MRKLLATFAAFALSGVPLAAQDRETDRLEECGQVMKEILGVPDNIPQDLLDKAECVVVVPGTKKLAFGFSGSYGRGAITCRSGEHFTGPWSAPAMYRLIGGGLGFQIGGEETDYILLVMNPRGANSILRSKVRLGVNASVAGGPKGRTAEAATNEVMRAEVLTYSRARGLFAGLSLEGANLQEDDNANKNVYGRKLSAREIVRDGKAAAPPSAKLLLELLNTKSPKNLSDPESLK